MESADNNVNTPDAVAGAFRRGRQVGLATAALALSIVSFVSLLGLEKAILAATLGIAAWRVTPSSPQGRKRSRLAIMISAAYVVIFVAVIVLCYDKFSELIRMLQQLG